MCHDHRTSGVRTAKSGRKCAAKAPLAEAPLSPTCFAAPASIAGALFPGGLGMPSVSVADTCGAGESVATGAPSSCRSSAGQWYQQRMKTGRYAAGSLRTRSRPRTCSHHG